MKQMKETSSEENKGWHQVFGITEAEENAILDDAMSAFEEEPDMTTVRKRLGVKGGGLASYKAFLYGRVFEMNNTIRFLKEKAEDIEGLESRRRR